MELKLASLEVEEVDMAEDPVVDMEEDPVVDMVVDLEVVMVAAAVVVVEVGVGDMEVAVLEPQAVLAAVLELVKAQVQVLVLVDMVDMEVGLAQEVVGV